MLKTRNVGITLDKSPIKKSGFAGYSTEQAISELIDNSIDLRMSVNTEHIDIHLDFDRAQIFIKDDGIGMNLEGLENALTVEK